MIWFFQRRREQLQCEIRSAEVGDGFELVWSAPDGRIHVERSRDSATLVRRRRALEDRLKLDGWIRLGRRTPPLRSNTLQSLQAGTYLDGAVPVEPAPRKRIIVRRGQAAVFTLLQRSFSDDSRFDIIWDRRTADRRRAVRPAVGDRRRRERRQRPPEEWQRLNYVITAEG